MITADKQRLKIKTIDKHKRIFKKTTQIKSVVFLMQHFILTGFYQNSR